MQSACMEIKRTFILDVGNTEQYLIQTRTYVERFSIEFLQLDSSVFQWCLMSGPADNRHRMTDRNCHLITRVYVPTVQVTEHWHRLPREAVQSHPWKSSTATWRRSQASCSGCPCWGWISRSLPISAIYVIV